MAELIAIAYDDEDTADRVYQEIQELQEQLVLELDDAAAVRRDADGRYHVTTAHKAVAAGTLWGLFWGALFGIIFFIPIGGLVFGGLLGALMGKFTDMGIKDDFKDRVRDEVKPGTSAVFMIVEKVTPDEVIAALSKHGGTVIQTSLSKEAEQELRDSLAAHPEGGSTDTPTEGTTA